jgi:hypothetical protein
LWARVTANPGQGQHECGAIADSDTGIGRNNGVLQKNSGSEIG